MSSGQTDLGGLAENAWVEYWQDNTLIAIQGGHGDIESSCISLDAKQALKLLEWLQQERETLERMAKEVQ